VIDGFARTRTVQTDAASASFVLVDARATVEATFTFALDEAGVLHSSVVLENIGAEHPVDVAAVRSLLPLPAQLPLWCAALVVDYVSASTGFRTPGLGPAPIERWDLTGPHIAERAALFVLIALGESFLVTGFAFVAKETSAASIVTMVSAFVAAAAMWWIYFDHGERMGSEAIARSTTPGRLARTAYTYVHLAVIAGIVVMSVADKAMLSHPEEASVPGTLAILGGPALFLVGTVLFRFVLERRWLPTQLAGIGALVAAGALAPFVPPVALGVVATLILVAVGAAESIVRIREGRRSGG